MSTNYTSAVDNRSTTHEAHLNSMTAAEQARHKRHISPIQGVTGNVDILKDLYNSKAHVLMVGDSISNNGGTDFTSLFHAALFNWKPLKWEGAYFGASVGGYTIQGFFVGINGDKLEDQNGDDYVEVADPGNNDAFDDYDSNLNGNYSTVARAMKLLADANTDQNQFINLQLEPGIFTASHKPNFWETRYPGEQMMLNNNDEAKMASADTPLKIGMSFFGSGTATYLPEVETRFNVNVNGTTSPGYIPYDAGHGFQTLAQDKDIWSSFVSLSTTVSGATAASSVDGTNTAADNYGVFFRENQSSFDADKTRVAFYNIFAGTNSDGLTISYAGDGGWRLGNHNKDYPGGQSFQIGNDPANVYPWSYSDEHIKERMRVEDTTHVFIHLGANDVSSSDAATNTAETMTTKLNEVLERYRKLRPGLKFIITTVYPVDATNNNESKGLNRIKFNDAVLDLAYKADDIVALDFDDLIFGTNGAYAAEANPTVTWFLDTTNGLYDGTHLSAEAAARLTEKIWDRVTTAVALSDPATSQHVSSDKEYTALLASMKHIK